VSFALRWPDASFHAQAAGCGTNQHGNMPCCNGSPMFVSVNQKPCTTKHKPQNLNLETYHPPKHVKFWHAAWHAF